MDATSGREVEEDVVGACERRMRGVSSSVVAVEQKTLRVVNIAGLPEE